MSTFSQSMLSASRVQPLCDPAEISSHFKWYAVQSRSRHEKRIHQFLQTNSICSFLPLYEAVHRWKDRRALVALPLFPGYLFVRIPVEERLRVLTAPGVVRLLSANGHPIPVPDSEIDGLQNCVAKNARMEPHPYLTVGRRVLVKSGPFTDMEGILVRKKGQFRLVVSVNLIARSIALELDRSDIVALSPYDSPTRKECVSVSSQGSLPASDSSAMKSLARASAA
jgi:transcription antitermination factor NusG